MAGIGGPRTTGNFVEFESGAYTKSVGPFALAGGNCIISVKLHIRGTKVIATRDFSATGQQENRYCDDNGLRAPHRG